MAESLEAVADGFPATPSMREVIPETKTEPQQLGAGIGSGGNPVLGIRRVGLRAEIDTSHPFGSVKEAVTRFEGSGPYNSIEDFDIKKVEEQAAKLEKDLIVKELETLDLLEELGAAKTIVEDLKQQLHTEALKCFATPDTNSHEQVGAPVINEMNQEQILQSPSPLSMSSPDLLLKEFKKAKMNLDKTINHLRAIQSSVTSLNEKMKKERLFFERAREKLASKFASVSAQDVAQREARLKPPAAPVGTSCTFHNPQNVVSNFKFDAGQYYRMIEKSSSEVSKPLHEYEENGLSIKTAEMRFFAAKKMEEAARAAEAVALAEINALSRAETSSEFALPEHKKVTFALGEYSPLNPNVQIPEESTMKKVIDSKFQNDQISTSKLTILRKLEEATEEVLHSKQILIEALNSVETANRKQNAAEKALRRWILEDDPKEHAVYNSIKRNKFDQDSPLQDVTKSTTVNNDPKLVLRSTVSLRDVLNRKQVPETTEMEEHTETKVALSQMLRALRDDLTLPTIPEKDESNQKQFIAQRKKFGFIQISFPLGKRNKKRE